MDEGPGSDDHFTMNGALIHSLALLKSLQPIEQSRWDDDQKCWPIGEDQIPLLRDSSRNATTWAVVGMRCKCRNNATGMTRRYGVETYP